MDCTHCSGGNVNFSDQTCLKISTCESVHKLSVAELAIGPPQNNANHLKLLASTFAVVSQKILH